MTNKQNIGSSKKGYVFHLSEYTSASTTSGHASKSSIKSPPSMSSREIAHRLEDPSPSFVSPSSSSSSFFRPLWTFPWQVVNPHQDQKPNILKLETVDDHSDPWMTTGALFFLLVSHRTIRIHFDSSGNTFESKLLFCLMASCQREIDTIRVPPYKQLRWVATYSRSIRTNRNYL